MLRKLKDESESTRKVMKGDDKGPNKTDSSFVEPWSDISVITVDSSKEQRNGSLENAMLSNRNSVDVSKAEVCPEVPAANSDISVDSKSVSVASIANGVIDASYGSDVSSKLNTSMEKDALNASFQWKVYKCISKEEFTRINQVAKDNLKK